MNSTAEAKDSSVAPNSAKQSWRIQCGFMVLCFLPALFLLHEVRNVIVFAITDGTHTYIPLIPITTLYLIYAWRDVLFERVSHAWTPGIMLGFAGIIFLLVARFDHVQWIAANQSSVLMAGFVLFWMGAFLLFFGMHSFRAALFPLLFLLFMIPVPSPLLSKIIVWLQEGSSDAAAWMFKIMGVPFLRQGFDFALPGVTIRVAEECSGIRSTIALLILVVLAGRLLLKNPGNRLLLCLVAIPMTVAKNGFRIAALSTLAIYVDPSFLTGPLHHHGGVVFFIIGLVPMFLLFQFLRSRETKIASPILTVERPQPTA